MYNKFMNEKEINVKVGDKVAVFGNLGVVTEVFKNIDKEWNGKEYVEVEGTESTSARVHFEDELANFGQYQDGIYGSFTVLDENAYRERLEQKGVIA